MNYTCEKCSKIFRDNYGLKRHIARKIPCSNVKNKQNENVKNKQNENENENVSQKIDSSGVTIINNGIMNIYNININTFKNEDLSHINAQQIIDMWRKINKTSNDTYIRSGLLISGLHDLIKKNEMNINVVLPNIRSEIIHVFTENGWTIQPTIEIIDELIKTRAGQLISFKDDINETNNIVFKSKNNRQTWTINEKFNEKGIEHRIGNIDGNKRVLQNIKVGVLKNTKMT
jgi:hypothetical protein